MSFRAEKVSAETLSWEAEGEMCPTLNIRTTVNVVLWHRTSWLLLCVKAIEPHIYFERRASRIRGCVDQGFRAVQDGGVLNVKSSARGAIADGLLNYAVGHVQLARPMKHWRKLLML